MSYVDLIEGGVCQRYVRVTADLKRRLTEKSGKSLHTSESDLARRTEPPHARSEAVYLNNRYSAGLAGKSEWRPGSAITERRLAATSTTNSAVVIVVANQRSLPPSSQPLAINMTALAPICQPNTMKHHV